MLNLFVIFRIYERFDWIPTVHANGVAIQAFLNGASDKSLMMATGIGMILGCGLIVLSIIMFFSNSFTNVEDRQSEIFYVTSIMGYGSLIFGIMLLVAGEYSVHLWAMIGMFIAFLILWKIVQGAIASVSSCAQKLDA